MGMGHSLCFLSGESLPRGLGEAQRPAGRPEAPLTLQLCPFQPPAHPGQPFSLEVLGLVKPSDTTSDFCSLGPRPLPSFAKVNPSWWAPGLDWGRGHDVAQPLQRTSKGVRLPGPTGSPRSHPAGGGDAQGPALRLGGQQHWALAAESRKPRKAVAVGSPEGGWELRPTGRQAGWGGGVLLSAGDGGRPQGGAAGRARGGWG